MMKQDVEILESHLRESPYIRIISNHPENGGDEEDDLGFEDYEENVDVDIPQQPGAYMGSYQQHGYADAGQPYQNYAAGAQGNLGQQAQLQGYQRPQQQGQIPGQRHPQQSAYYAQGGEFEQHNLQQVKVQGSQGYQQYEQVGVQGQNHPAHNPQVGQQSVGYGKSTTMPAQAGGNFKQQHQQQQNFGSQGQQFNQPGFKGQGGQMAGYGVQNQPVQGQGLVQQPPQGATQATRKMQQHGAEVPLQHQPHLAMKQPAPMMQHSQKDNRFEVEADPHMLEHPAGKAGPGGFQARGQQQRRAEHDQYQMPTQLPAGSGQHQNFSGPQQPNIAGGKPTLNNPPNQYYQKPRQEHYGGKGPYQKPVLQTEKTRQPGQAAQFMGSQPSDGSFRDFPQQHNSGDSGSYYSSHHQSSAQSIDYSGSQPSYKPVHQQQSNLYTFPQQPFEQAQPVSSKKFGQPAKVANQQVQLAQQQQSGTKKQSGQREAANLGNQTGYVPPGQANAQQQGTNQAQSGPAKGSKDPRKPPNVFDDNIMEVPRTISEQPKTITDDQLGSSSWINPNVPYEKFIDDTVENINRKPGFNRQKKKCQERKKKLEDYLQSLAAAGKTPEDEEEDLVAHGSQEKDIKPFEGQPGKKMELDFGDSVSSASSHEEQQKVAGLAQVEEGEEEYPDIDSSDHDSDEPDEVNHNESGENLQGKSSGEKQDPSKSPQKEQSKAESAQDSGKDSKQESVTKVKQAEIPADS